MREERLQAGPQLQDILAKRLWFLLGRSFLLNDNKDLIVNTCFDI